MFNDNSTLSLFRKNFPIEIILIMKNQMDKIDLITNIALHIYMIKER